MHYATLHQVRAYLGLGATNTGDDSRIIRLINYAVGFIDLYKGRRYDVRLDTLYYDVPKNDLGLMGNYAGQRFSFLDYLRLGDDLLEVVSLVNGDGSSIPADSYVVEPYNTYPKFKIVLLGSSGAAWAPDANGNVEKAIKLTGYFGMHDRYADAFEDSLDTVQDDPLSASATTLTVSDADGVALDGSAQRFQAGQMLKLVTSAGLVEFVYVAAVNNTTNTLTISRGYNGTTAVAHAQGEKIYIFRPMENVVHACTRLVAWAYRQKDADVFDKSVILGTGIKVVPSNMPPDVVSALGAPRAKIL